MAYLLIKSLHLALVLFWVAGMVVQAFVLAAADKLPGPALPQELARLRLLRKWERLLTTPSMVGALASGVYLATSAGWFGSGWLSVKLALVLLLAAVHGMQAGRLRRLAEAAGDGTEAGRARLVPVVLAAPVLIILLVVMKPF
ncbi:CopD family protein [Achromobacter xylosoxidans]|uniref:CopD family protein n=1 Tax=Alcaligenes xylosoxydans xylosoxydans TaxID=85698 RepID=UPI0022B86D9E|nr:CopD family protein [Achromobacter xylosoxidans]MCZ8440618.1 CopD family protein [Achromobacter xylosoxidans]